MIARLAGTVIERAADHVVLDVGGVGYRVFVSAATMGEVPAADGRVVLLIHTLVREDAIHLFGFASATERELFRTLLKLSGIGPKNAMHILSGMALADLVHAIGTGDVDRLVRLPGVGRKTAERIVVELRDRIAAFESESRSASAMPASGGASSHVRVAVEALCQLGVPRARAEKAALAAAQRVSSDASLEIWIREALRDVGAA